MEKMIVALLLLIMKPDKTASDTWNVTFENPDYCILKGSSVEFACSYHYADGEIVKSTGWQKGDHKDGKWTRVKLSDIPSYENRSEYLGDLQHNCGLAIHNLQDTDTGHYYFRFDTDTYGRRSKDSVYLTVTELNARVSPRRVRAGDHVTLECNTSCQTHRIVWLKDGRPVTKSNFQAQPEDSGSYVCTVEGQESVLSDTVALDVLYCPLNVSIEVSHTGLLTIGSSVNLTCISAANPAPYNYTWYTGTVSSSMLPVGSGQVLSIPTLETSHSGLYVCQAWNHLGGSNSTEVRLSLETDNPPLNVSIEVSHTGLLTIGSSVNLTCISAANPAPYNYTWYTGTVSSSMLPVGSGQVLSIPTLETSHSGLYVCQAWNHLGGSNSTEVRLSLETDIITLILYVGFGVKIVMVLLLSLVIIWAWRQCRVSRADREVVRTSTYNMSEEYRHDYENVQG